MLPEKGPTRNYYLGYASDLEIRKNAASGGIATALLQYCLETALVDEVAIVEMENEKAVVRMTSDLQQVTRGLNSKYAPVPLMATVISELRKRPRRIALAVTPCQLGGWMRAAKELPQIRDCLVLSIGLFCGQVQTYDALKSIAATIGLRYPGKAKFVGWREGKYPGYARFELPNGKFADKYLYPWLDLAVPHFSLKRCFLCPDGANWMADMTLGDFHKGGKPNTTIVCRTKRAEQILEAAKKAGEINYCQMGLEDIEQSTVTGIVKSKMRPALGCISWMQKRGMQTPVFDYDKQYFQNNAAVKIIPLKVIRYRLIMWLRIGWRRQLLIRHPWVMEKIGHFLYQFPSTLPGWTILSKFFKIIRKYVPRF